MRVAIFLLTLVPLAACTPAHQTGINDPLEPMNRRVHAFNVGLDRNIIKPLAAPMKGGEGSGLGSAVVTVAGNAGSNLSLPGKTVNKLLQGRPIDALQNATRFVVNTTLGFGGLTDPAAGAFNLPEKDTDFGETLAVWGLGEGPYLELPVLGPSNLRDATGKVVDVVIDPLRHALPPAEWNATMIARVGGKAAQRARFGDTVESVLHGSADSYAQTRQIWLDHRRHELGQEADVIDPYAEN
ncbi:MAG: VacJ family lipoprotein [Paracoccus sp. (in: a-proteobacteria)]|uniref:MlaA family lipoprotein n=1 Tax=Paracoccus sp. TaxID=267 RepID=UPI0026DF3952|nr:VacJ family lipoprotein [Paracoccus sp. (in: a-proteobacteria)]MDO5622161.1 VacJ family lipoprotein [Paracoccus sp. (in: a-proteobacteria)]